MNRDRGRIADRFRTFAEEASSHGCPLYAHLARCIIEDPDVLFNCSGNPKAAFAQHAFRCSPFSSASETGPPAWPILWKSDGISTEPGRSVSGISGFLLDSRTEIIPILQSRITQTNEVRRCAYLIPSFQWVYEKGGGQDLSLIDVGCSAGLHLLWDRYHYDYGSVQTGNPDSTVQIDCELRGSLMPPIPEIFPSCAYRVGVDLHPIDLRDPQERLWLEALVFPDHVDRRILLNAAIAEALPNPLPVVAGDATELLPRDVDPGSAATSLCIYHCHAMCQLSEQDWKAFEEMLLAQSRNREIFWLLAEGYEVQLRHLQNGEVRREKLAGKDGHGRWLEWVAD